MTVDPAKVPNMTQRSVLQHLSLPDWKLANRLPVRVGEMTLSRLVQQGWIEIRGKDQKTEAKLTEAGIKATRSLI